jgi:hypothetical protein
MAYITQTISFWLLYNCIKNRALLPKRIKFASLLAAGMINYQVFILLISLGF